MKVTITYPDQVDLFHFIVSAEDSDDPDWGWEETTDTLEEALDIIKQKELTNDGKEDK